MADHNDLGRWGEDVAADYLQKKGYTILERDWRSGHRDIDVVALSEDGTVLVFVEVKTRRNQLFTDALDAVDYHKVRSLQQAANHYVKFHRVDLDIRFDIITVVGTPDAGFKMEHIQDVF